ncbi:MAG: hypothetical protein LAQ69_30880 [Acidobacteriia bacterium]|nr:hypothetical protein [Terriglobia bacterium]
MVATDAPLGGAYGIVVDPAGNLLITDQTNNIVIQVTPSGVLTVVAGKGRPTGSFSGDGGPAIDASFDTPQGIAMDAAGNLFVADTGNCRIRKIAPSGIISTVAGTGTFGYAGDGGPATKATLKKPGGIAVDSAGNLYLTDSMANRVRKVTPDGIITTVAGNGNSGFSGDGGPATGASLHLDWSSGGLAVDAAGNLYIADFWNNRIRKVAPDGTISTVAGGGSNRYGDNIPATSAALSPPVNVAVDGSGNLYIALDSDNIRKVTAAGMIVTVAGGGTKSPGDGGPATSASLEAPQGMAWDVAGNLYIAAGSRVRKVTAAGVINTVAGSGQSRLTGDGGPAVSANLSQPSGVALGANGNLYVADTNNNRVRKVTPAGVISTVAGNGSSDFSGDGGPATSAALNQPRSVTLDAAGNLYISDTGNCRVRKVTPGGIINTIAGSGGLYPLGDGGPATSASMTPYGLAVDPVGNLYIADRGNERIRKVTPAGTISTVAGGGKEQFVIGDGGPATSAFLDSPQGVTLDTAGNMFIGEQNGGRVRKVTPAGIISTVAGVGQGFCFADGVPATSTCVGWPVSVAVDAAGNLYIADEAEYRIRKVAPNGIITTVAGTGFPGFTGDGGDPLKAQLNSPSGVALNSAGDIYIADSDNGRIRLVQFGATNTSMPTISSVLNAASYDSAIAASTWITIDGTNLAASTRLWQQSDLVGGKLPTQLDGVRVTVNDKPAYVYYISPTQINALTGSDQATGTVPVVVTTQQGTSAPFSVRERSYSPALFAYPAADGVYVIAQTSGGAFIGRPNLMPGVVTRPVSPGELISIYGTGFGPTNPPLPPDSIVTQPAPTAAAVTVQIGGLPAPVSYAGLIGSGLYQINLKVPDVPAGDQTITATVGGYSTPSWGLITVQR